VIFDALVFGHLRRNGWRVATTLAAIALAVAIIVVVRVTDTSLRAALAAATESLTDDADLAIIARRPGAGFDDRALATIVTDPDVREARPQTIDSLRTNGRTLRVRGIDAFAPLPRGIDPRERRPGIYDRDGAGPTVTTMVRERGVIVSQRFSRATGIAAGQTLVGTVRGRRIALRVAATFEGIGHGLDSDDAFVDIATAYRFFGRPLRLDRIDITTAANARGAITARLHQANFADARIVDTQHDDARIDAFAHGFGDALAIFAWLAFAVGAAVVAGTLSIGVARRSSDIGTLRTLGATRRQIFAAFLTEGAAYGAIGAMLGVGLGMALASWLVPHLVARVDGVVFDPWSMLRAASLGVACATLAAIVPAWRASGVAPALAMRARGPFRAPRRPTRRALFVRIGLIALACSGPHGALAALLWTIAIAALVPFAVASIACIPAAAPRVPLAIGLGWRQLGASTNRTTLSIASLTLAIAATASIATFANSFGASIVAWTVQTYPGDFRVDTVTQTPPPQTLAAIRALPGVARATPSATSIAIEATPRANLSALRASIEHLSVGSTVVATRELRQDLFYRIDVATIGATALASVIFLLALGNIASMVGATVFERRLEMGTLRQLGASARVVRLAIVCEASTIGALGAMFGTMLGVALASERIRVQDAGAFAWRVSLHVPLASLGAVALVAIACAAASGALPAYAALRARAITSEYVA